MAQLWEMGLCTMKTDGKDRNMKNNEYDDIH